MDNFEEAEEDEWAFLGSPTTRQEETVHGSLVPAEALAPVV